MILQVIESGKVFCSAHLSSAGFKYLEGQCFFKEAGGLGDRR